MAWVWPLLVLAGIFELSSAASMEICNAELATPIRCQRGEIIMMTSAEYGRKEVGRCIRKLDDFMGCTNDVLPLLDRWCSGRRECIVSVPNEDLENRNENCMEILMKYLEVHYTCLSVGNSCSGSRPTQLVASEGMISSQSVDTKGCGSSKSPWIISAKPGQTINISIVDFSSESGTSAMVTCPTVYGYIRERALGINHTICGGRSREGALYTSKTNAVEIQMLSRNIRGDKHFVLKYKVTGCPELSRPAHAWYKREGNEAVIGCETNDQEWRLTCNGNTWIGEVGNCSRKAEVILVPEKPQEVGIDSVVVMTGIAGGAVVICVVAMVIGTVYIKKYRMRQETKHLTKTYATLDGQSQTYYRPVNYDPSNPGMTFDPSIQGTIGKPPPESWDTSRNQMTSYPDQCTCATLPARANNGDERQSIYNSIKST